MGRGWHVRHLLAYRTHAIASRIRACQVYVVYNIPCCSPLKFTLDADVVSRVTTAATCHGDTMRAASVTIEKRRRICNERNVASRD